MKISLTIFAVAISFTLSSYADDTEIYFDSLEESGEATFNPNVLFIFDTSGSMGDEITTRGVYDPSVDYGSSSDSYIYVYQLDFDYVNRIHNNQNQCDSMKAAVLAPDYEYRGKSVFLRSESRGYRNIDDGDHFDDGSSGDTVFCEEDSPALISDQDASKSWSDDRYDDRIHVSANYHDFLQGDGLVNTAKIEVMKAAAIDLVNNFDALNFGLMRFRGGNGGYVISEFQDITPAATKVEINAVISGLLATGSTPLAETMYEAYRYYSSGRPDQGAGYSIAESVNGDYYSSPILQACQDNHIVYLTDGLPTSDSARDSTIRTLTGDWCESSSGSSASNTCLDELAEYMKTNDLSALTDTQTVTTHTIGFDIDMPLLQTTASKGGGRYYTANDTIELRAAFNSIIVDILGKKDTFVAPAVSVNAYNTLQNRSELYYALFEPANGDRWHGNIKRYKISSDGTITDADGDLAIDPATGFFTSAARSWWSSSEDGDDVQQGGVAGVLPEARTIFTYTADVAPSDTSLSSHPFSEANATLTHSLLGVAAGDDTQRSEVIRWVLGEDVEELNDSGNTNNFIGDLLHSRPEVVVYGGTENQPDATIFAATNQGLLVAVDAETGVEEFAFIPKELLGTPIKYFENGGSISDKVYGLDGATTIWREESLDDTDVTIESGEGDFVYLYQGMRRGGNDYYALDVTNRSAPIYKWKISGGTGDFPDLGQSWSKMLRTKLRLSCTDTVCDDRDVLVFSGGYDTQFDDEDYLPTGTHDGAAIYIVDANTGAKLWSAGASLSHSLELSEMINSIPSDPTIGDLNSDGVMDVLFAVDITGQLFRIDFSRNPATLSDVASGGVIFDLGDTDDDASNDLANFRRFYNSPDVALFNQRGEEPFFSIAVNSGYRSHPKNLDVVDRLFVLYEGDVFAAPDEYVLRDESDLFDATYLAANKTNHPNGWFRSFTNGEKGLSSSVTFGGRLLFSTYLPQGAASSLCSGSTGGGRLYNLDILTGRTALTNNENQYIEYQDLNHGGIPPNPSIIYVPDDTDADGDGQPDNSTASEEVVCVGTECFGDLFEGVSPIERTYWREN